MSFSKSDIDIFDKYINNELSCHEVETLKEKLEGDEDFNTEFIQYKNSVDAINLFSVRKEMKAIMDQREDKANYKNWYWSAAAILFLIGIPLFLLNQSTSPNELFQAYYTPFPADQNVRGSNDNSEAMKLYREGNYGEAIVQFHKLSKEEGFTHRYNLFLGNCYLKIEDSEKAIYNFEISVKSTNSIVRQHSEWYLSLAYLKNSNVASAQKILTDIADTNHLYSEKAIKLLSELN